MADDDDADRLRGTATEQSGLVELVDRILASRRHLPPALVEAVLGTPWATVPTQRAERA
ncbi:hypothetical protein [Cellulomonas sp. HZM]|uniref:hypothetical protein n=1 Tax=Cellulomonas sp. HZM TaxID=1454010 RepID=UPI000A78EBF1|nr:hypothetical protein [Cellulomonas sp. HZM]